MKKSAAAARLQTMFEMGLKNRPSDFDINYDELWKLTADSIRTYRKMSGIIKIILAALLFVCLLDMPYGYFQLVRFIALVGFSVLAYQANQRSQHAEVLVYLALAVLFQPFFKVSLGRQIWNIVDVVIALGLITSASWQRNQRHGKAP